MRSLAWAGRGFRSPLRDFLMADAVESTHYGRAFGLERAGDMIGAVVGVQPFGGERLSGTGPKAGGPHYMFRFATERTLTVNTAAVGGNALLLELDD